MTGQHIEKLRQATKTSEAARLGLSSDAWRADADTLRNLAITLNTTAQDVERGFSDGVEGADDGTAKRGSAAFRQVRKQVLVRVTQMDAAADVLRLASDKLKLAEDTKLPDGPPAELPPRPSSFGSEDDIDVIRAQQRYGQLVTAHTTAVNNYGAADEDARKKLEAVDAASAAASTVLAKIHGEPVYPEDLPPPGEEGPGGFPTGPAGRGRPAPVPVQHPTPAVHVPGFEPGENTGPEYVPPGPVGGTLTHPGPGTGTATGSPGGGGLGINPVVGGGLAAGVFGGPGLVKAVRGALSGRGVFGSSPGTIGSTSRTGGAGTLGRSGGAAPGSPVSRNGGRGAGGAGGGRPGTGAAGGRGRGGGRGAPGTGAGGRGRRGRDEEGRERDLFDDASDWIDDEGAGPDVLG